MLRVLFLLPFILLAPTPVVHPRVPRSRGAITAADSITLLQYRTAVPPGWTSKKPSSSMRLAEFSAPAGASSADIVVYFFGTGQGGSVEANLARWKAQFTNPSGGAVYEKISHDSSHAFPVTIAEYRGTYARGIGMGSAPEQALPNHILIAIVAETPRGTMFFQMYGPAAAAEAQRAAYLSFVKGLH